MSTRLTILASWRNAQRQADVRGAITLTAASFAGYALATSAGDVEAARRLVPLDGESFWARVQDALDQVAKEENVSLRAAGGERR